MLVETQSLTKRYGTLTALADCSFAVPEAEVCGLLGPNGSGKTTLLRLIMGFLRATSGSAAVDRLDCYRQRVAVHRRIAYLPGEVRLFRNMRGRQILKFFSQVRAEGRFERALEIADRLGLDLARQVARCSTGMRQKMALAATLSLDLPLIILDEPTANLDPTVRAEVLRLIAEARADGRTVIFSSHVLSEVEQACDRVVMLRKGELVHDQMVADLRRRHHIGARLNGTLPAIPQHIRAQLSDVSQHDDRIELEAPGDLAPLLEWLSSLPLDEVRVEPVGLQAVYDKYHERSP
jgi:ABC-2 type transport system ATP-binding protein